MSHNPERLEEDVKKEVRQFRTFKQNTHSPATNNSVGAILLRVWERYSVNLYEKLLTEHFAQDPRLCEFSEWRRQNPSPIAFSQWLDLQSQEEADRLIAELKALIKERVGDSDSPFKKWIAEDLIQWVYEIPKFLNDEERENFRAERADFIGKLQDYAARKQGAIDLV